MEEILSAAQIDESYQTLLKTQKERVTLEKDSELDRKFFEKYTRLCDGYSAEDAKRHFTRFFVWQCKNAELPQVETGQLFQSFLSHHEVRSAFTNHLNIADLYPTIETGIVQARNTPNFKTTDAKIVLDQQALDVGEDMTVAEQLSLLRNDRHDTTCCITNGPSFAVKTTANSTAFWYSRPLRNKKDIQLKKLCDEGLLDHRTFENPTPDFERFVILISHDVTAETINTLLHNNPDLSTEQLTKKLVEEISAATQKQPVAVSIVPIEPQNKTLRYAVQIPGKNETLAQQFKEELLAEREFDKYRKLNKALDEATKKTAHYLAQLNEEIAEEQRKSRQGSLVMETLLSSDDDSDTGLLDEGRASDLDLSPGPRSQPIEQEPKPKNEKEILREEISALLQLLRNNTNTPLERLKAFSESLFGRKEAVVEDRSNAANTSLLLFEGEAPASTEPAAPQAAAPESDLLAELQPVAGDQPPTLAKRIENTRTGFDYLKAVVGAIVSFAGFLVAGLGAIPVGAYYHYNHKLPWQTTQGSLTNCAEEAGKIVSEYASRFNPMGG